MGKQSKFEVGLIKLTIDNSYSKIEGLSVAQHRSLKKLLSYKIDAQTVYHSGGFRREKSLLGAKGDFPSGLLIRVNKWLWDNHITHTTYVLNKRPPAQTDWKFNLKLLITPYKEQRYASRVAYESDRGTISMPTGSGKSVTMALLVACYNTRTLIIVPNLTLKQQLTESFTEWFGSLENITITNIDDPNLINEREYGLLIIDESHHVAAKTYRTLNKKAWNGIANRYYFTATAFRADAEEQMLMEAISGDVIYKLTYKDALASRMIAPIEAYYVEVPKTSTDAVTWREVYDDLIVNNELRNVLISGILVTLTDSNASTLCLVKEIAHGDALSKVTEIQFANGQIEGSSELIREFAAKRSNSLIATTRVCGEGVDTKAAEYVIIAGLGRSKPSFMQQCGRVMRKYEGKESGKVIIFRDASHKFTLRHFREQCKILKDEFGVIPVRLDI